MLWVDVLNDALEWSDLTGARLWAARRRAGAVLLQRADHDRILEDVGLFREAFAADYLRRPLTASSAARLDQWVAAVTLSLQAGAGSPLRARRARGLPEPFESALTTALVQFVAVDRTRAHGTHVHRCHGFARTNAEAFDARWDEAFADLAQATPLLGAGYRQCERLIESERGSRYCCKACSNASFAARKALANPEYFAAKQSRYRARQRGAARVEAREGAFVYMD